MIGSHMDAAFRQWFVRTPIWRFVRDHSTPERKKVLLRRYIRFVGIMRERRSWFAALRRLRQPWRYFCDIFSSSVSQRQVLFSLRQGPSVWVRAGSNDRFIFDEIFFEEVYRPGLPPANVTVQTIVDVGAQVGMTSLWLQSRYPGARIHSLEPMPENFAQLQKNVHQNGLASNMAAYNLALSDQNGEIVMTRNPENKGGHSMFAEQFHGEEVHVPCVTLQAFFDRQHIQSCDLMKMDVEGAEYPIFYAAPREVIRRIKCLVMEHHVVAGKQGYHPEALEVFLREQGFEVQRGKTFLFATRQDA